MSDSVPPRCPSPVPTEPGDDPDPDFIALHLAARNIKVRDFASPLITDTHTPLTPEIFDPYKALGEFEYRLRQNPRTLPIPGKHLRRLVEIGWVSEDEVRERCHPDDLKALADFDEHNRTRARALAQLPSHGYRPDGSYPYLTLKYTHVPSMAEREGLADSVRVLFLTVDRVVRMAMAMERQKEQDRIEGEQAEKEMRRLEEERRSSQQVELELEKSREEARRTVGAWVAAAGDGANSRKRSPHEAWAEDGSEGDDEDSEAKRLRLARSQSEVWYNQQQPSQEQQHRRSQPPTHTRSSSLPQPPEKQYPAPLSAYDPELYPDAASVIESQSQSQGSRLPYYREEDITPPLTPPLEEMEEEEDTRPNALKRPPKKALKRGLTRGRTLVQIC